MILGDDDIMLPETVEEFNKIFLDICKKSNVVKYPQRSINSEGLVLNEFTKYSGLLNAAENLENKIIKSVRGICQ